MHFIILRRCPLAHASSKPKILDAELHFIFDFDNEKICFLLSKDNYLITYIRA